MTASMDHELRSTLQAETSHLAMQTPVEEVLARGDRIRRQRRRGIAGGVLATGVLAAAGTSIILPAGSSPLVPDAAAWGSSMVNLQPATLTEAGKQCAADMRRAGWDMPADAIPIAADSRSGVTVAVYRIKREYGVCTYTGSDAATLELRSASNSTWEDLPTDTHVKDLGVYVGQQSLDAPTQNGVGAAQVSPETETVKVEVAGQVLDAAVDNGIAAYWTPDGATMDEIDDVVLTAYDSDGTVLSSTPLS